MRYESLFVWKENVEKQILKVWLVIQAYWYKFDQNSWRVFEISWLKKSLKWNMFDDKSLLGIANLVFQWDFVHDITWCEQSSFHVSRKW